MPGQRAVTHLRDAPEADPASAYVALACASEARAEYETARTYVARRIFSGNDMGGHAARRGGICAKNDVGEGHVSHSTTGDGGCRAPAPAKWKWRHPNSLSERAQASKMPRSWHGDHKI